MEAKTPDREIRMEMRRIRSDRRTDEDRRMSHLFGQTLYIYVRLLYDRREENRRIFHRRALADRRMARA